MEQILGCCKCIDESIGGGIKPQTLTLIYGEPETGKSTLAMQFAVDCANKKSKVLFVDCDNTFSSKRLSQISGDHFKEIAEWIILVKPKNFKEQTALIDQIQDYIVNVGLIVIDTFTSLYSAETAEGSSKAFSVNRELNRQLAILAQIVKTKKIPLIITSQVRNVIGDNSSSVRPVANRVLKFWADNIISLKPVQYPRIIKVTIEKASKLEAETVCYIQIEESGLRDTQYP